MHLLAAQKKGQHKEIWVTVASNMAVGVMSHDVTIIHQSSTPPMTSEASSFCRHGKGAVEDMTSLDNTVGAASHAPPREPFWSWLKDGCKKSRILDGFWCISNLQGKTVHTLPAYLYRKSLCKRYMWIVNFGESSRFCMETLYCGTGTLENLLLNRVP